MAFHVGYYCSCGKTLEVDACETDVVTCACGQIYDLVWDSFEGEDGPEDFVIWKKRKVQEA